MPNRGAMTNALQPAPFRKADGPSFSQILLRTEHNTKSYKACKQSTQCTQHQHAQSCLPCPCQVSKRERTKTAKCGTGLMQTTLRYPVQTQEHMLRLERRKHGSGGLVLPSPTTALRKLHRASVQLHDTQKKNPDFRIQDT